MEHVEDLETWLMDGEDNRAIGVCQFVEVREKLHGRCGVQSYTMHNVCITHNIMINHIL